MSYCRYIRSTLDFLGRGNKDIKELLIAINSRNFISTTDILFLDYEKSEAMMTEKSEKETLQEIKEYINKHDDNYNIDCFLGVVTTANRINDKKIVQFIRDEYPDDQINEITRDYRKGRDGNILCQILIRMNFRKFVQIEGAEEDPIDQMLNLMKFINEKNRKWEDKRAKNDNDTPCNNLTSVATFKIPNSFSCECEKFFMTKAFTMNYETRDRLYWQFVSIHFGEQRFNTYYKRRRNKKNAKS